MDIPREIQYKEKRFILSKTNPKYYYAAYYKNGKRTRKALHRVIWEDHNSQTIPLGFHVHHKDGNTFNNDPMNLELMDARVHLSKHMKRRYNSEEKSRVYYAALTTARTKAAQWHKSEKGREFHRKLGKESWKKKQTTRVSCVFCGKKFSAFFPSRAKYCDYKCIQKHRYRLKTDFVERTCANCGNTFSVRKNEPTQTCSASCSALMREARKRSALLVRVGCYPRAGDEMAMI